MNPRPHDLDPHEHVNATPFPVAVAEDCDDCLLYRAYWRITWEPLGTSFGERRACAGCAIDVLLGARADSAVDSPINIERIQAPAPERVAMEIGVAA